MKQEQFTPNLFLVEDRQVDEIPDRTTVFAFNSELTRDQERILDMLVDNFDTPTSKADLYEELQGTLVSFEPNTIELHVGRMRKKMVYPEDGIKTVRGQGYILNLDNVTDHETF